VSVATATLDISAFTSAAPRPRRPVVVDPLTGLANHRAFQERLRNDFLALRREGRPLSLARFDIDRFKHVNETAGHDVGDRVLMAIAERLQSFTRAGDTLARIAGDEFALILPGCLREDAFAVVERARNAIAATPVISGCRLTISAGICERGSARDADDLYELAGIALGRVKRDGRDATCVHQPAVDSGAAVNRTFRIDQAEALIGIRALARAVDAKDPATQRHSERVAMLACQLAEYLGWTPERVLLLEGAALVHDVGKLAVPDTILLKPGRLDPDEYEIVKRHAALSAEIVGDVLAPEQVAWIRGHHERPDGTGYPDGLAGAEIPDGAQLLALADAFDVMTGARPYSSPRERSAVFAECRALVGAQFAAEPVSALLALAAQGRL
jgi:diguanylate cyclase (GGDEF)-like protein